MLKGSAEDEIVRGEIGMSSSYGTARVLYNDREV
jgi:hypothetical protein